jgi:AcrR family transcriptional regulator
MSTSTGVKAARRPFVPPPAPRTPKSARTRQLLLDAAAELFIERGYGAASLRDIAAAADLTIGAVYGHFRSKGQLLVEVIRCKTAERDGEPAFLEALAEPERAIPLMYDDRGRAIRILEVDAAAAARHDPDVAAGLASFYEERFERIRDAMADVADPETSAWLVGALSGGIGMREAAGMPQPDPDRLHATIGAALRAFT